MLKSRNTFTFLPLLTSAQPTALWVHDMSEGESTDAGRAAKRARTSKEDYETGEKEVEQQTRVQDESDDDALAVADMEAEKVPVRHDLYLDTVCLLPDADQPQPTRF